MLDMQLVEGHPCFRWWPDANRWKFIAEDNDEIHWFFIMLLVVNVLIIESH